MKPLFDSLVRTYVPYLVGLAIGWLVSLGVPLDPDVRPQVTAFLMAGATFAYYALARVFELYVSPRLGWLLGLNRQPDYGDTADAVLARLARLTDAERDVDIQAAAARLAQR